MLIICDKYGIQKLRCLQEDPLLSGRRAPRGPDLRGLFCVSGLERTWRVRVLVIGSILIARSRLNLFSALTRLG